MTLSSSSSYAILEKSFSDEDLKEQFDFRFVISGTIQAFGSTSRLYVELRKQAVVDGDIRRHEDENLEEGKARRRSLCLTEPASGTHSLTQSLEWSFRLIESLCFFKFCQ